MATDESTTPARRNRTPFTEKLLANARRHAPALPLFVHTGKRYIRASDSLVLNCARQMLAERFRTNAPMLSSPQRVREFLSIAVGHYDVEVFAVVLLDGNHRFIDYVELFHGTIDCVKIYTRRVVECVLAHCAAGVLLVHNHPSGVPKPSRGDVELTFTIRQALATIDVRVVDHFVVGESVASLHDLGLLT